MTEVLNPKHKMRVLACGVVRLRPLTRDDLPLTLAWRNHDGIRKWFFRDNKLTMLQHTGWFESYLERDNDFVFVIEETAELRRPVGQVALYQIDWVARRAEYGRLIIGDQAARGRGIAQQATRLLLDYGVQTLGLDEIYLEVFAHNVPALAVYRSCGFIITGHHEGVIRMAWYGSAPSPVTADEAARE